MHALDYQRKFNQEEVNETDEVPLAEPKLIQDSQLIKCVSMINLINKVQANIHDKNENSEMLSKQLKSNKLI